MTRTVIRCVLTVVGFSFGVFGRGLFLQITTACVPPVTEIDDNRVILLRSWMREVPMHDESKLLKFADIGHVRTLAGDLSVVEVQRALSDWNRERICSLEFFDSSMRHVGSYPTSVTAEPLGCCGSCVYMASNRVNFNAKSGNALDLSLGVRRARWMKRPFIGIYQADEGGAWTDSPMRVN